MNDISPVELRKLILECSYRAHMGHIGSSLSVADILAALYSGAMRVTTPDDHERDRFMLSKGHSALALYATLTLKGWLTSNALNTFCEDGSALGVHPEHIVPGIDFSTGSLGYGLSIAAGSALAARLQASMRRVFTLISDAECNEGSIWEAAMFAAHHQLSNLIAIIDLNGQQATGYTRDTLDLSPMAQRWQAFGWEAVEVDGHDPQAIASVIAAFDTRRGPPHVMIAKTIFGKGVSFMENLIRWHYQPMDADQYQQALAEVMAAP